MGKWLGSTICNICNKDAVEVSEHFYDMRTKKGPWALLCEECRTTYGISTLGMGFGQRYLSATKEKVT
jgi:hypothetical protein